MREFRVRRLLATDWHEIAELEHRAYAAAGLSEGPAVLASRARTTPELCLVLETRDGLAGYVIALPYPAARVPDLTRREHTAFRSSNLHLHDLVIAEEMHGRGLGALLLRRLTATAAAHAYDRISLVAVAGSDTFWSAKGFRPDVRVEVPGGYGENAVYMSKSI